MCFHGLIPEGALLFFKTHVNTLYVSDKIYLSHFLRLKISLMLPPGSNTFKREALHKKRPIWSEYPILSVGKKKQAIC